MPKGVLILAQTATANPNGTISILNGWVDRIGIPRLPVNVQASLVVRIVPSANELGDLDCEIRCLDENNAEFHPRAPGKVRIGTPGVGAAVVLPVNVPMKRFGRYAFALYVAGKKLDRADFELYENAEKKP